MNASAPLAMDDQPVANGARDDPAILLAVLDAIDNDDAPSQRSIASDLGIALGMVNAYVKRCVKKGYVKLSQAPANRYLYYLTPHGLAEKTRLASEYLQQSLNLFREARGQYGALVEICARNGWSRIALAGGGDMAEIAVLCTVSQPKIQVVGIVGAVADDTPTLAHLPLLSESDLADGVDAVLVTSIAEPAAVTARLGAILPPERVLVPKLLLKLRFRSDPPRLSGASPPTSSANAAVSLPSGR